MDISAASFGILEGRHIKPHGPAKLCWLGPNALSDFRDRDDHSRDRRFPRRAEIQYLFGLTAVVPAPALDPAQEQLSHDMVHYRTQFARSGNPNSPNTPPFWPSYETATDQIQSLVPPTPQTETGFAADQSAPSGLRLEGRGLPS